jgi:argininosuccinate lyase
MHETGRIKSTIHPEAREIVFDADLQRAVDDELPHYAEIDRAQAIMLEHAGLLDRGLAIRVLVELDKLQADAFRAIALRHAPRGAYLSYEDHLRAVIGDNASNLHLGRSRNDINATLIKLKLRQPYRNLAGELIDLLRTLCRLSREHLETIFPLHTHRQPAVPSTLAHHLVAFAIALERDLDAVLVLASNLNSSCLGAGVGGGTTLPILPSMTSQLLGFSAPPANSIDSVASRDLVLRLLAAAAILGSNVGRIAETMLLWVGDASLIVLPDDLVGSSSAMPHKRNPFLLEHVQGKAGAIVGHLMAALTGMHAAPFTNCVAVGTEASSHVWIGLRETTSAVRLVRLCLSGMAVNGDTTADMLDRSFVNAMETATRLALTGDLDFREAHNTVGRLVTLAVETGVGTIFEVPSTVQMSTLVKHLGEFEPQAIARAARAGGGPAPDAVATVLDTLEQRIERSASHLHDLENQWSRGRDDLRAAISRLGL